MALLKHMEFQGRQAPLHFGPAALTSFLDDTGLDTDSLATLFPAGNKANAFTGHQLKALYKIAFYALKDGARKAKEPFDATWEDVADEVAFDEEKIALVAEVFIESFPKEGEKKAKAAGKGKAAKG